MRYTAFCAEVRRQSEMPFSPSIDGMLRAAYRHRPTDDAEDLRDYIMGIARAVFLGRQIEGEYLLREISKFQSENQKR